MPHCTECGRKATTKRSINSVNKMCDECDKTPNTSAHSIDETNYDQMNITNVYSNANYDIQGSNSVSQVLPNTSLSTNINADELFSLMNKANKPLHEKLDKTL